MCWFYPFWHQVLQVSEVGFIPLVFLAPVSWPSPLCHAPLENDALLHVQNLKTDFQTAGLISYAFRPWYFWWNVLGLPCSHSSVRLIKQQSTQRGDSSESRTRLNVTVSVQMTEDVSFVWLMACSLSQFVGSWGALNRPWLAGTACVPMPH